MTGRVALGSCVLCLCGLSGVRADDTDIIVSGAVEPNVLILFDSSGSMDDQIDGVSKLAIAKQVVTNLLSTTSNVRFGVMKFRTHGGQIVSPIGTPVATMVTAVNNITTTSVGTPLGDQLYDAGLYFKGTLSGHTSPIQQACQRNFAIVVTDGLQTQSNRHLPDEATLRFAEDHAGGFQGLQNVVVHTIGFGIDAGEALAANAILEEAAANGGGLFFSTDDAAQLQVSLQTAIQSVIASTFSFAAPLVPSTSATGNDLAFQASFLSDPVRPFWRGYLGAYERDADGTVATDADGVPDTAARVWEAGERLAQKAASTRTIFTVVSGAEQSFLKTNGAITPAALGVGTSSARDNVIDFVRGVDAFDEDGDANVTEQRPWKLGDILHSRPVLISRPPLISPDADYQAFQAAHQARTAVLLVGANDGMLHAFQESDGEELWAFIPPDLLANLEDLTASSGPHAYYVDSSPVAADIRIGDDYRTVVIFGERRGGRSYHALDVTDPADPAFLWSFTDAKLGETWSVPVIGRVRMADDSVRYVAFVGGGYDTAQNNATGKVIFAIDMATGAKLWEYASGISGDRQYLNFSLAASPTALDLDGDGFVDRVYAGDVGGQLWKFDLSQKATLSAGLVDNWPGKRLFAAAPAQANPPAAGSYLPAQAIYGAPTAALDELGQLWVFFGTGDLNHPLATSQNRFYGLRDGSDMTNGAVLTEGSLVDVTSTDVVGGNGWYFRLANNEKVLGTADVFNEIVYFTTFTPTSAPTCVSGAGPSRLYAIEMLSGYAALDWSTGEPLEPTDSSETRSTIVGSGLPSAPLVVTLEAEGVLDTTVMTGTTDEQLSQVTTPTVPLRKLLYWKEVF